MKFFERFRKTDKRNQGASVSETKKVVTEADRVRAAKYQMWLKERALTGQSTESFTKQDWEPTNRESRIKLAQALNREGGLPMQVEADDELFLQQLEQFYPLVVEARVTNILFPLFARQLATAYREKLKQQSE